MVSAFILGLVQGVTEFLPISSTGHLIIIRDILSLQPLGGVVFDATLHLATVLAVIIYFRSTIMDMLRSVWRWCRGKHIEADTTLRPLLLALIVGSVPAVVVGILFRSSIESTFRDGIFVASMLIIGSIVLFMAERLYRGAPLARPLSWRRGLVIGCFQALAIIPGMSRSGMSIAGGMLLGLTRERAMHFAFLLGIPIILGAGVFALLTSDTLLLEVRIVELVIGMTTAFISAFLTIHFLMYFLRTNSLYPFIVYRIALAFVILMLL